MTCEVGRVGGSHPNHRATGGPLPLLKGLWLRTVRGLSRGPRMPSSTLPSSSLWEGCMPSKEAEPIPGLGPCGLFLGHLSCDRDSPGLRVSISSATSWSMSMPSEVPALRSLDRGRLTSGCVVCCVVSLVAKTLWGAQSVHGRERSHQKRTPALTWVGTGIREHFLEEEAGSRRWGSHVEWGQG